MTTLSKTQPQKAIFPKTYWGETKAFLALGLPIGLGQLISYFVYAIDAAMIGRLGEQDLAASGLGLVVFFVMWMLGSGAVFAVTPMVSQALGENQNERRSVRVTVRMSFWIVIMMSPLAIVLSLFTEPLLVALGQDPAVSAKAADYMLMIMLGWPFALMIFALRNFLSAIEKVWWPMALISLTTVINAGLNWVMIYGNLGFPRLELIGAGIASSLSYLISFLFFVAYVSLDKKAKTFRLFRRFWRPHWGRFRELLRLGIPITIMTVFEGMLFNVAYFVMGGIGVSEQAAYHIGLNVAALAFMVPFGLSMAGSVRVGLAAGARNMAALKRSAIVTFAVCLGLVAAIAVIVALFPRSIMSFYLDLNDPDKAVVIALVASFLPIAAAFMLYDAAQVVANQLLRGVKDVNWPMIITGFSYWFVGFPLCYYWGLHSDFGAKGVWYGLSAGLFCAFILLTGRFIYLLKTQPAHIFATQTA